MTDAPEPFHWSPGDSQLILDMPDEAYHASNGVSKSKIWAIETKTPFLARYEVREEKPHFDFGHAAHIAILEPDRLEDAVMRGPMSETQPNEEARSNSTVWKHAMDEAAYTGRILLKPSQFDLVMQVRDLAGTVPELELMRDGTTLVEASCYGIDPETGLVVRCRPDLYNVNHKLMVDIKNLTSAAPSDFERDVGKFGFHMQDAAYQETWNRHSGYEVEGFWFLAFEKSNPPQVAAYELTPEAVAEGHARWRRGLQTWADCEANGEWPSYPKGIQRVGLRRYDYQINPAPEA